MIILTLIYKLFLIYFLIKFYSIKTVFCYYFININSDIYICIYKKLIEI